MLVVLIIMNLYGPQFHLLIICHLIKSLSLSKYERVCHLLLISIQF